MGCDLDTDHIFEEVEDMSLDLLRWLAMRTKQWPDFEVELRFETAAKQGDVEKMHFFMETMLQSWSKTFCDPPKLCYHLKTVQWAIKNGSGFIGWKCEHYRSMTGARKAEAARVLAWGHANGCPCTCKPGEQQQ